MTLTGRVLGPDGRPWELHLHVDDASYHTPDLAIVQMHPTDIAVDASRRSAERVPIGGVAWLEAVNCQDVVDRDRVDGTLEDLSRTGVSFATSRVLRVGDRLIFHGRFFADSISGEVRVASVRPAQLARPHHRRLPLPRGWTTRASPRSTASSPAAASRPSAQPRARSPRCARRCPSTTTPPTTTSHPAGGCAGCAATAR